MFSQGCQRFAIGERRRGTRIDQDIETGLCRGDRDLTPLAGHIKVVEQAAKRLEKGNDRRQRDRAFRNWDHIMLGPTPMTQGDAITSAAKRQSQLTSGPEISVDQRADVDPVDTPALERCRNLIPLPVSIAGRWQMLQPTGAAGSEMTAGRRPPGHQVAALDQFGCEAFAALSRQERGQSVSRQGERYINRLAIVDTNPVSATADRLDFELYSLTKSRIASMLSSRAPSVSLHLSGVTRMSVFRSPLSASTTAIYCCPSESFAHEHEPFSIHHHLLDTNARRQNEIDRARSNKFTLWCVTTGTDDDHDGEEKHADNEHDTAKNNKSLEKPRNVVHVRCRFLLHNCRLPSLAPSTFDRPCLRSSQ